MTKDEFIEIFAASDMPPPMLLTDGRWGICPHFNSDGVLCDAYRDNECEQVLIPFHEIAHVGGALIQVKL